MTARSAGAQPIANAKYGQSDKFRQLDEILPTPNSIRTASGAPGPAYWQQRADYVIDVELDENNHQIRGSETVTYTNNSPDSLPYLWLQLDPNLFARDSAAALTATDSGLDRELTFKSFRSLLEREAFDGGVTVTSVVDARRMPLPHTIVGTMMRIDLPAALASGQSVQFSIDWHYTVNDLAALRGRTGYERFADGNCLYGIAQWYPRLAAYTDYQGWQHKQYLGQGEFTLEFGDYLVRITVPDDHLVAATGVLLNPDEVLSETQRQRLAQAASAERPTFIVTPDEARANEQGQPTGKRTWIYQAHRVRDFAFASSRRFIWDALGHDVGGNRVMAMSFYPREGEPLWSRYSTHAIVLTLDVYSRLTFPYPYPVAISVNGPIASGMEYPMICFNGPRPEKDGTYSKRTKYGLISVIIHEVGHNWFPMIVNSDERQWTWLDEGLNTFLQYLTEQEWEARYPSRSGEPQDVTAYLQSQRQVAVMTQSDSLLQFYDNAYRKPATALNVLRESVLGRELFDRAFQHYARQWMFKRPTPADFFRCLEDASGVDLDWFWRGWFYSTDHCDLAIVNVRRFELDAGDPEVDRAKSKAQRDALPETLARQRNRDLPRRVDAFPELQDFYNHYDELDVTAEDRRQFELWRKRLSEDDRQLLKTQQHFYAIDLQNVGGLVMPVILDIQFADGRRQELRIPAEIWRYNSQQVSKLLITDAEIRSVTLDPYLETADADLRNNYYPQRIDATRFRLKHEPEQKNEMQKQREGEKAK